MEDGSPNDEQSLEADLLNEPLPAAPPPKPETEWQAIGRGAIRAVQTFVVFFMGGIGFLYLHPLNFIELGFDSQAPYLKGCILISALLGAFFGVIMFFVGYYGGYTGFEPLKVKKAKYDDGAAALMDGDDGLLHVDEGTAQDIDERF